MSLRNSWAKASRKPSMEIFSHETHETHERKPSPTGEAAPAERLEVTWETPPVRKNSFVRRPLRVPPPASRPPALPVWLRSTCQMANLGECLSPARHEVTRAASREGYDGKRAFQAVPFRLVVRAALGRGAGERQKIFRVFRVFRGKKFQSKLKIQILLFYPRGDFETSGLSARRWYPSGLISRTSIG